MILKWQQAKPIHFLLTLFKDLMTCGMQKDTQFYLKVCRETVATIRFRKSDVNLMHSILSINYLFMHFHFINNRTAQNEEDENLVGLTFTTIWNKFRSNSSYLSHTQPYTIWKYNKCWKLLAFLNWNKVVAILYVSHKKKENYMERFHFNRRAVALRAVWQPVCGYKLNWKGFTSILQHTP